MTTDYIEVLLRAIDPAISDASTVAASRQDEIWRDIVESLTQDSLPRTRRVRHPRRYWGVSALGTVIAAAVFLATSVSAPTSALAATLRTAVISDSGAAALTPLAPGQYYYQASAVSLVCSFAGTDLPPGQPLLTYVANGTMESWTGVDGSGKVVLTPSAVGTDGSHFATPSDEARWTAMGKPFIPCALSGASNQLSGNPANANNQSNFGGVITTVSGFGAFGLALTSSNQTSLLSATTNVNNLPSSVAAISNLLVNGQINADGSISSVPQVCPILDGSSATSTGCAPSEELSVIEQLLQLPDASAKLGSVLYQVLASLPNASLVGTVTTLNGSVGTAVQVPQGSNETFQVVLDPTTGALLSCSEFSTINGVSTPIGSINYGPVQVVQGQGATTGSATHS